MATKQPDNPYGYQIHAQPKDDPGAKEWVERAPDSVAAQQVVDYLTPRLPQGWEATKAWGQRDMAVPVFDPAKRLREAANVPPVDAEGAFDAKG
jgi:hypothetical protein